MQGVQVIQDPETLDLPAFQNPQFEQTSSPIKTVLPQMGSSTKTLRGTPLSKHTGELCFFIIAFNPIPFVSPFSLPFLSFFFSPLSGQASVRSTSGAASSLESEDSEGGR